MSAISPQTMAVLAGRMGEGVLRQRLAMESEQVSHHYRHVEDFLHPEHLPSAGRLIHRGRTPHGETPPSLSKGSPRKPCAQEGSRNRRFVTTPDGSNSTTSSVPAPGARPAPPHR